MKDREHRGGLSRLHIFFLVSVIFHFLAIWFYDKQPGWVSIAPSDELEPIQVILIETNEEKKQIVKFDQQTAEKPKDSKFYAKHDYAVDTETVSKSKPTDVVAMTPEALRHLLRKPTPSRGTAGLGQKDVLAKFFPKDVFQQYVEDQKENTRARRSLASETMTDHIEKVEVGAQTLLNTAEFKFYSYFTRMKQRVHRSWTGRIQTAAVKSWMTGRRLASAITHQTVLVVILDKQGRVLDVVVKKSSGVEALDKASVEAFLESGPFPNPPKGLLQDKDNIQITWSFHVNVT